jgi:proteic killer suppression protein
MIAGFRCKETEKIWNQEYSRKLPSGIQETALTRLRILNAAVRLENLKIPPGNRLEPLKGGRKGQHSIRINRQWRICFTWRDGHAYEVEIVDYH